MCYLDVRWTLTVRWNAPSLLKLQCNPFSWHDMIQFKRCQSHTPVICTAVRVELTRRSPMIRLCATPDDSVNLQCWSIILALAKPEDMRANSGSARRRRRVRLWAWSWTSGSMAWWTTCLSRDHNELHVDATALKSKDLSSDIGCIPIAIRARFDYEGERDAYDSSTIQHPTRSYEELCAFEQ